MSSATFFLVVISAAFGIIAVKGTTLPNDPYSNFKILCVGDSPEDPRRQFQFLEVDGTLYKYPGGCHWRQKTFCGLEKQPTFVVEMDGINDKDGQKKIIELLGLCQKMNKNYKWVQPFYQDDYWYLFKAGNVYYGRVWDMFRRTAHNDIWHQYGGGFLKESCETLNYCRFMYDYNELDYETSIDAKYKSEL